MKYLSLFLLVSFSLSLKASVPVSTNADVVNKIYNLADRILKISENRKEFGWNDRRKIMSYLKSVENIMNNYEVYGDEFCRRNPRDQRCNPRTPRNPNPPRGPVIDGECVQILTQKRPRWFPYEVEQACTDTNRSCVFGALYYRVNWRAPELIAACRNTNLDCVMQKLKFQKWHTAEQVKNECRAWNRY